MARVFVTRTVPGRTLDILHDAGHETIVWPGELPPPPDDLAAALRDADAALTMVTDRVTGEMLEDSPSLRIIANMAVGYDNASPEAAARHGVWVTNTPGVLAETTADFAWSIMLAAARNVALSDRDTRAGGWKTWSPTGFLGVDLYRATLGVIGLGEIGEAFARRARGFDMHVLYASRTRKTEAERDYGFEWTSLADLLHRSDFISLHVPLNDETHHLMGPEQFARVKPGSVLVNTARGQVVDQDALVEALREGRLGGAALDVTDPEPLPLEHPLFSFPQVVITPHIASASLATRSRMGEMAAENIVDALAGKEPPHAVNRPVSPRPSSSTP